jgi:hypothetical protein
MSINPRTRRRRFGVICIAVAIAMLIAGETVLKAKLSGVPLLCYWLACFVFTMLAVGVALLDAARVRQELRDEQRALVEDTLQEIERKKQSRDEPRS